jgi:pimeloyl-ACP methyl ester carboxylesterase
MPILAANSSGWRLPEADTWAPLASKVQRSVDAGASMPSAKVATTSTRYLVRPEGRIAYEVSGGGPLVVCIPGMGELRSSYRLLAPSLAAAGFRVASMDLRGHGDSDTTFTMYDDVAAGTDALALVDKLDGPAVLIGNSMGAGAAAWAAAERPDDVTGLVLLGPFVRNSPVGLMAKIAFRLALLRPWRRTAWLAYHTSLFPGRRPPDLKEHQAQITRSLQLPGHWQAFIATARTSHAPVEARLGEVRAPTLVIMGGRDPDFRDPKAEAELIAARLHAEVLLVPDGGHYPQVEFPEIVTPKVLDFVRRVTAVA